MTNQPAQPTPLEVADLSEAEINQRVLAKARKMSPAEILALSIRSDIHRPFSRALGCSTATRGRAGGRAPQRSSIQGVAAA